ncbi:hypothetical protein DFS33DRAFT_1454315 [Desarmillaria ectypa]|nr:hypothetical protein DFS33DRAFT_1454315 [Desarmillaria ectypa]
MQVLGEKESRNSVFGRSPHVMVNPASSDHNSLSLKRQTGGMHKFSSLATVGEKEEYLWLAVAAKGNQEACGGFCIDEIRTGDAQLIGTGEQTKDHLPHSEPSWICWRATITLYIGNDLEESSGTREYGDLNGTIHVEINVDQASACQGLIAGVIIARVVASKWRWSTQISPGREIIEPDDGDRRRQKHMLRCADADEWI